jgi:hypothetical protein
MKKIVFILLAVVCFASAQSQSNMTTAAGASTSTLTNAGTVTFTYGAVTGAPKVVSAVAALTKASGTVSGTVYFEGSNDGTYYGVISSSSLSDASANYSFKDVDAGYLYYQIRFVGSGTLSATVRAKILIRKP